MEGFMGGFVRGGFISFGDTWSKERKKGKKHALLGQMQLEGPSPDSSEVNILILHAQLTTLTNQRH